MAGVRTMANNSSRLKPASSKSDSGKCNFPAARCFGRSVNSRVTTKPQAKRSAGAKASGSKRWARAKVQRDKVEARGCRKANSSPRVAGFSGSGEGIRFKIRRRSSCGISPLEVEAQSAINKGPSGRPRSISSKAQAKLSRPSRAGPRATARIGSRPRSNPRGIRTGPG